MKLIEALERQAFEISQRDADYLAARLLGNLERHGAKVSIRRHVGHVRLPSGDILRLRTVKAPATSLLAWLAYVDPSLGAALLLDEVPAAATEGDLGSALAWLFTTELRRALEETGLIRRYRRTTAVGSTVRGRIDFTALARQGGDLARLPCNTWERQPRSPLNETLRAALDVVYRSELMRMTVGSVLNRLLASFRDIEPRADAQLLRGASSLNRTEQRFATALRLARLLLHGSAIGDGTDHSGVGFLINVEQLFEDAVVRGLRESGHSIEHQYPLAYQINAGSKPPMQGGFNVDAYCQFGAERVVVDAKFKREISASNLQQMLAYCYMSGATRAVLVLPAEFAKEVVYTFVAPQGGPSITIHVVGLSTSETTVAGWRSAGLSMARRIAVLSGVESCISPATHEH